MVPDTEQNPSLAELARTALDVAGVGTLTLRGRAAVPERLLAVRVLDAPDGRPVVSLDRRSPWVRFITACPVVTLSVPAPMTPFVNLQLTGPAHNHGAPHDGLREFRISLLSAQFSALTPRRKAPVPLGEFHAATPDPFGPRAQEAMEHLETAHHAELLACVRAHGRQDARAVVPTAIDRYGLALGLVTSDGVSRVRLSYPGGPVDSLGDVAFGLRTVLTCHCGAAGHRGD